MQTNPCIVISRHLGIRSKNGHDGNMVAKKCVWWNNIRPGSTNNCQNANCELDIFISFLDDVVIH